MLILKWTEKLSVGVASLDADHQLVISLMSDLHDAILGNEEKVVISSSLQSIEAYTDYHFSREERIMTACDYPAFAAHKIQHDRLRADVLAICRQYEDNPQDVGLNAFQKFLSKWWNAHILGEDMMMKPHLQANAEIVTAIGEMPLIDLEGIEDSALSGDMEWQI